MNKRGYADNFIVFWLSVGKTNQIGTKLSFKKNIIIKDILFPSKKVLK